MSVTVHSGWVRERPHARTVARDSPFGSLTAAEMASLRDVCEHGFADAARLGVRSGRTITNHLTAVYRKLGIGGGASGKIGQACYLLGRHDERTGQGR